MREYRALQLAQDALDLRGIIFLMKQKGLQNVLIVIIAVIILAGIGGYFLFVQIPERVDVYTNERLGYSFTIPNGYRLASDYIRFLNTVGPNPIRDYTDKNAEYVLITTANNSAENDFLNEMKQVAAKNAAEKEFFFVPKISLAQFSLKRSIEIYPIPVSLEQIKETATKWQEQGRSASSDFSDIILQDGTKATQYIERSPFDEEVLKVVYIPIQGEYLLRGGDKTEEGDKIDGITIKMNQRSDIFDNNAFEEIINSFKLNR